MVDWALFCAGLVLFYLYHPLRYCWLNSFVKIIDRDINDSLCEFRSVTSGLSGAGYCSE